MNSYLKKRSRFPMIMTWGTIIFFYLPLLVVAVNSFNDSRVSGEWKGFTLKWYASLFTNPVIWEAFVNTMIIALVATSVSTVIGTFAALALHKYRTKLQSTHFAFVCMPLIVPDILLGMSLLLLMVAFFGWANPLLALAGIKLKLGLGTIIIAHITFCISYVTMVIMGRLQDFDYSLLEAAQDLGANRMQAFTRVMLPSLAPGITAGALFAFTLSIDDFVISFFMAGSGSQTLPIYIYGSMKHGTPAVINALSVIFLIMTFITVYITQKLLENKK